MEKLRTSDPQDESHQHHLLQSNELDDDDEQEPAEADDAVAFDFSVGTF